MSSDSEGEENDASMTAAAHADAMIDSGPRIPHNTKRAMARTSFPKLKKVTNVEWLTWSRLFLIMCKLIDIMPWCVAVGELTEDEPTIPAAHASDAAEILKLNPKMSAFAIGNYLLYETICLALGPESISFMFTVPQHDGIALWNVLKAEVENDSTANKARLNREFHTMLQRPSEPASDYARRLKLVATRLASLGVDTDAGQMKHSFISGLTGKFGPFRSAFAMGTMENLTYSSLVARAIEFDQERDALDMRCERGKYDTRAAYYTPAHAAIAQRSSGGGGGGGDGRPFECFHCGKQGHHYSRDCRGKCQKCHERHPGKKCGEPSKAAAAFCHDDYDHAFCFSAVTLHEHDIETSEEYREIKTSEELAA